jgi:hypothetical protein
MFAADVRAKIVTSLAARDPRRTEADLQGDIYALLTTGGLALEPHQVAKLEVPTKDGTRRRLDVEIGHAVIEVKKDLRKPSMKTDAEEQLAGYVAQQTKSLGTRYVGILTDGTDWYLYHLVDDALVQVAQLLLNPTAPDHDRLIEWLESILATETAVQPSAGEIERRLGAESPAHLLDHASLQNLYANASGQPEVQLKRALWAKLLRTAFGQAFNDDEDLFINHTLLVLTAEIIAHAVIDYDVSRTGDLTPQALARGTRFADSRVHGVVEEDFFDWVLDVRGGPEFVTDLADRIGRFNWLHVEHDVLKVLYESVISQASRSSLGEYYTPDWLAEVIVNDTIVDPLTETVLDPACGSGTFVFHAIRAYLAAADAAGTPSNDAVGAVTRHVMGMDVHPVAATFARVTYLLAIGTTRLSDPERPAITIPIYLGDSVQWEQHRDLLGGVDDVRISTSGEDLVDGGGMLFGDDLVFPRSVLVDAAKFDRLVTVLADQAKEVSPRSSEDLITGKLRRLGVNDNDLPQMVETFDTLRRLHASGRDHIWGYYVRNLIRPLWLSEAANQVTTLVGNPPWLRYSKMTVGMQRRFKELSKARGLTLGSLGGSGRDLSTLFVVRAVELYLKPGGRFAFVMPHGTLTRKPHDGFRSGNWYSESHGLGVRFDTAWDLSKAPTGFPMVSCVVRGRTDDASPCRIPTNVQQWVAKFRNPSAKWAQVQGRFVLSDVVLHVASETDTRPTSPYKQRFRQGAVLAPRALLFVNRSAAPPLGTGAGRVAVESRRTTLEKPPWKTVKSLTGVVERSFIRSVHLGETVLPYRVLAPLEVVLPIARDAILTSEGIEEHSALDKWWTQAEERWDAHKSKADPGALLDRIDFHKQLSAQLGGGSLRVVYAASGNTMAAAIVDDEAAIIEHKLYWAPASSREEGLYLTAVLNSNVVIERVRPMQPKGLFGERDIDKYVWQLPIPLYDNGNADHATLVALADEATQWAQSLDLSQDRDFKRARTVVRDALQPVTARIDELVKALLAGDPAA